MHGVLRKFLPVIVGFALASIPFAIFEFWLDDHMEREARSEVAYNAKRAIGLIDWRLSRAVASLENLVEKGAVSCRPRDIESLRTTTFATSPIKEISVIGLDGATSCSDLGLKLGHRQVVGQPQKARTGEVFVEVVHLADFGQSMIRLRRTLPDGDAIAALIAPDALIPITAADVANGHPSHVRVQGRDGTLLADINVSAIGHVSNEDLFVATAESERFGIRTTVWRTREEVVASNNEMRSNGFILCAAFGLIVFALTIVLMQRHRRTPQERLSAALAAGEFVPYYQPIIEITTGRLIGSEVLVRWRKPDGTLGMPGTFIHHMEDNGLIAELSRHLMRQACIDLADVYGRCQNLRVTFNLTADQFADESTVTEIRSIFLHSPIRLSQIVLELTERQEPADFKKTRQIIASLQVLGCKVALDDVGTGHSGLSSILKLGVDIIKIDKMFVDSMDDDRNSAAIIGTLVELARKLGMDTVAEGVEHFEQVLELRRRGIRAAQGFVFSPALPASAYVQLINALNPVTKSDLAAISSLDPNPPLQAVA